jgi:hypothetical protein
MVQTVESPASLKNELVTAAKGNLSDIVFERVGKRIRLSASAQLGVVYDNGHVDISMNGVTTDDLGQLNVADVLTETIARTGRFAIEALTLPVVLATTQEKLDFEADVLDGIKDGFRSSGGNIPAPVEVAIKTSIQIHASVGVTASNSPGLAMNPLARK